MSCEIFAAQSPATKNAKSTKGVVLPLHAVSSGGPLLEFSAESPQR